ncbi:MAG: Wadjet anti-phage system protein JetD domain-containing protein, partial [Sciscionella sp.]
SILMDRATLLAHEDHWVTEPNPVNAPLELLRPDEADLYRDLVENAFGQAVRLEQERVRFSVVERALGHCGTTGNASGSSPTT